MADDTLVLASLYYSPIPQARIPADDKDNHQQASNDHRHDLFRRVRHAVADILLGCQPVSTVSHLRWAVRAVSETEEFARLSAVAAG